eukprot:CAMPEP_0197930428 /NCGR_PEP_ID=MMETSP1439-20131203/105435_1 /TAXON_ID=66791 /ORGANISM="Gonyaulax spinifera, Strain CCMP409" /LENGTH=56 /DNA_ID=CAMNT_0043553117 /DNA_START=39 /DNA_END=205 /DNA_ORIENTATION=+
MSLELLGSRGASRARALSIRRSWKRVRSQRLVAPALAIAIAACLHLHNLQNGHATG